ncbi:MAG TPA: hypothetical protein VGH15_05700 [Caulobacteraceae bacterium]|jgi:hypothetical protein
MSRYSDRYLPSHRPARTSFAVVQPSEAWRALVRACDECRSTHGPGAWEALKAARAGAIAAPFPISGEVPRAAASSLLELARTWPQADDDQRGWHAESVAALARQCEALLDQQLAAFSRRMTGERD